MNFEIATYSHMNQQPFKMNFGSYDMYSAQMQQLHSSDCCENGRVDHKTSTASTAESTASGVSVAKATPSVPKCIDKTKTLLPIDFQPSNYSIICGNKRKYFNSVGNSRLRVLVKSFIPQFSQAEGKLEKGMIVTKVMSIVKEACPVGAFVTMEKGRWWQVSERTSREKVGSLFRDFLSNKYKSSAQNKIARRKSKREESKQKGMLPDKVESLPPLVGPPQPTNQMRPRQNSNDDEEDGSVSSASCSFYDVDDLCSVPLEEL